jgi:hypothetical protein
LARVTLPRLRLLPRYLAPICVVTGATEEITFHEVTLNRMAPLGTFAGLLICGPIGALVFFFLTRRTTRAYFPFSHFAYQDYRQGQLFFKASLGAAIVLMLSGFASHDMPGDPQLRKLAALLFPFFLLGSVLLPIVAWFVFVRGKGPRCIAMDEGDVVVEIPNAAAAAALLHSVHAARGGKNRAGRMPATTEEKPHEGTEPEGSARRPDEEQGDRAPRRPLDG